MDVDIAARPGYLEVSVSERGDIEDARQLLQKTIAAVQAGEHQRILISVRRSAALEVEKYGLADALTRAAGVPGLRVALVADSPELFASYQYIEALAAQKDLEAKAFRSESAALGWLLG